MKKLQRFLLLYAIFNLCLMLCACGDWESQAGNIINLLLPAIQAAIAILAAFGIGIAPTVMEKVNLWGQKAEQALLTVKGLVAAYKAAAADAQPGILSEIQAALSVVAADLTEILPELNITDPATQAKIQAAFAAISAFIATLLNLVPAIKPKMSVKEEAKLNARVQESTKQFRTDFNAAVESFGKQYEI